MRQMCIRVLFAVYLVLEGSNFQEAVSYGSLWPHKLWVPCVLARGCVIAAFLWTGTDNPHNMRHIKYTILVHLGPILHNLGLRGTEYGRSV
jgi:hypothetical protein